MSLVKPNEEFTTHFNDKQFLHFASNSCLGITLIQKGYLKYFNKRFAQIFRYHEDEISNWKKREFYKIVLPDDLQHLVQKFRIEDRKTISIRFRGITKDKEVLNIENYVYIINYNNKKAYLSSYMLLEETIVEQETYVPKTIRINLKTIINMDYDPKIVDILKKHGIKFNLINYCSYREEN